jgi:Na+-driven multidrug efflux pump
VLSLPALYLGIGYGTATGTFLTKSLNRKDFAATRETGRKALLQVMAVSLGFAAAVIIFSAPIRHWFFKDQATFLLSKWPFILLALLGLIDGLCCALQRFHFISDGIKKSFVIMTVVQWGFFIPGAWVAIRFFGMGYVGYCALHVFQRAAVAAILYVYWLRRVPVPRLDNAVATTLVFGLEGQKTSPN